MRQVGPREQFLTTTVVINLICIKYVWRNDNCREAIFGVPRSEKHRRTPTRAICGRRGRLKSRRWKSHTVASHCHMIRRSIDQWFLREKRALLVQSYRGVVTHLALQAENQVNEIAGAEMTNESDNQLMLDGVNCILALNNPIANAQNSLFFQATQMWSHEDCGNVSKFAYIYCHLYIFFLWNVTSKFIYWTFISIPFTLSVAFHFLYLELSSLTLQCKICFI